MHLMPKDMEKLLLHYAGEIASQRKQRGLKLNYPEAIAYISREILERARDGMRVSDLVELCYTLLSKDDCMEGVPALIPNVQVEATFPDGTKLVSVNNPIRN